MTEASDTETTKVVGTEDKRLMAGMKGRESAANSQSFLSLSTISEKN